MWSDMMKRWMSIWFWWLPRNTENAGHSEDSRRDTPEPSDESRQASTPTSAEPEEVRQPETPSQPAAATDRQKQADPTAATDDLTVIKGIGPAMREKLRDMGIASFADLSNADPDELTNRLKTGGAVISGERVRTWIREARDRQT